MPQQGGDPYQSVRPGQQIAIDHRAINGWNRAARGENNRQTGFRAGRSGADFDPARCLIKNASGQNLGSYSIVGLGAPLVTPAQNLGEFKAGLTFTSADANPGDPFALTLEAIPNGSIGLALLSGAAPCQVNIADTTHQYCGPINSYDHLLSAPEGPARILWQPGTTGIEWCYVQLAASVGTRIDVLKPNLATVLGDGTYDMKIQSYGGSLSFSPGADVYGLNLISTNPDLDTNQEFFGLLLNEDWNGRWLYAFVGGATQDVDTVASFDPATCAATPITFHFRGGTFTGAV